MAKLEVVSINGVLGLCLEQGTLVSTEESFRASDEDSQLNTLIGKVTPSFPSKTEDKILRLFICISRVVDLWKRNQFLRPMFAAM